MPGLSAVPDNNNSQLLKFFFPFIKPNKANIWHYVELKINEEN